MNRSYLWKIVLILGGIMVAVLLMEGVVRLVYPQIFLMPPGMYEFDPDVGYVFKPGFEGNIRRSEFDIYFTIGQSGLRSPDPRPRQANTIRILVLGDSQAWGFGVADHETFAVRLERLLADYYPSLDVQVLNAGVPGYGTADQLAFLQSRGPKLEPDLVIVQFLSVNDLEENRTPARTYVLLENGELVYRAPEQLHRSLPAWRQVRIWLKQNSHLARLTFDTVGYLGTRAGVLNQVDGLWGEDFTEEDAKLGVELLIHVAQTAQELNAPTLFLYTTGQAQVVQDPYEQSRSARIVEEAATRENAPWIDASEQLQQRPNRHELYYARDGHWTPAGHQAIAETLAGSIIELRLIESRVAESVR